MSVKCESFVNQGKTNYNSRESGERIHPWASHSYRIHQAGGDERSLIDLEKPLPQVRLDYKGIRRRKNALTLPQEPSMPYPVESLDLIKEDNRAVLFPLKRGGDGVHNHTVVGWWV